MSDPPLPPGASTPREDRPHRPRPAERERDGQDSRDRDRERGPTGASSSTMALVLHGMTFLCCANWLFGVIGIVFAVRAAHKRDRGLYAQAETLTRYSWYCLGAAAVMFVVMAILTLWLLTQAGSMVQDYAPVPY
ncbi:hypothetical protein F4561_004919 [Lipingzhangella halophila]|uniref:Interferon-induced transmembrane protein n=1 Tax=Lipingzhangella halophila TaxID=1783352 RepID=A0A7W7RLB3_9ACTN|nr:hypothetical protein [Lipingzhangella halophila]MBB4934099.1 hypothetical protein [Lipingzhangella halophila]